MNNTKVWFQSRTLWINGLILVLAILDAVQALPVPATWAPYIIAAASVLNVALRLTTNTGLTTGVPLGEQPAYRAAHDASGDPDAPNGGHVAPQTARLPAAPDAPLASPLARQIAADNGMDPDHTPEDTI